MVEMNWQYITKHLFCFTKTSSKVCCSIEFTSEPGDLAPNLTVDHRCVSEKLARPWLGLTPNLRPRSQIRGILPQSPKMLIFRSKQKQYDTEVHLDIRKCDRFLVVKSTVKDEI